MTNLKSNFTKYHNIIKAYHNKFYKNKKEKELIGYQYEDINDYLKHKKFINNKREI